MTPQQLIAKLWGEGIPISLSSDGKSLTVPAGKLTDTCRALILSNKQALIRFLTDAQATTADLLKAAMRACDHHGDNDAAREQMRADCLGTPPHLQADLLDHFKKTYPESKP